MIIKQLSTQILFGEKIMPTIAERKAAIQKRVNQKKKDGTPTTKAIDQDEADRLIEEIDAKEAEKEAKAQKHINELTALAGPTYERITPNVISRDTRKATAAQKAAIALETEANKKDMAKLKAQAELYPAQAGAQYYTIQIFNLQLKIREQEIIVDELKARIEHIQTKVIPGLQDQIKKKRLQMEAAKLGKKYKAASKAAQGYKATFAKAFASMPEGTIPADDLAKLKKFMADYKIPIE